LTESLVDPLVIDASVALTWAFKDEASEFSLHALRAAQNRRVFVPVIWWFEISNAIVQAVRRGRMTDAERRQFYRLVQRTEPVSDSLDGPQVLGTVTDMSLEYSLTAYDASYLELAMRRNAQLATLDKALIAAANRAGVALFNPEAAT